jgi:hypothetical protein
MTGADDILRDSDYYISDVAFIEKISLCGPSTCKSMKTQNENDT